MSDDVLAHRATAKKLAERAKTDTAFKEQIQKDPFKTLIAAGLPEKAVPDFLRESGMDDVSGYIANCWDTCLISSF